MIQAKRRDYSGPNEKEGQWKKAGDVLQKSFQCFIKSHSMFFSISIITII